VGLITTLCDLTSHGSYVDLSFDRANADILIRMRPTGDGWV
jgi:hypothetical protein